MNTPSHHRVHHGRDPKYLDKNYAGVFIIWDRMFGTFKEEEETPNYGVTKPLKSWNPVYANFAHYIDLAGQVGQARNFKDGLRILFKPPGWKPAYLGGADIPPEVPATYHKYDVKTTLQLNLYIFVQFLLALGLYALFFFKSGDMLGSIKGAYAIWIVLTTLMFGFLFELNKIWLAALEIIRLLSIPVGIVSLGIFPDWAFWASMVFSAGSIACFLFLFIKTASPDDPSLEHV